MDPPKINQRAEKRTLREKMRGLGLGYDQIAAEFARRYRLRPRTAWREAYGWSLVEAAQRINDWKGQAGLDPDGVATMTGARLCEHEQWPGPGPQPTGRKPTPRLLALLAAVYRCPVLDLVDLADREHLPAADLLVLDTYHPSPADRADEPISPPATLQQQTPARPPAAETWPGAVEPRHPAVHLTPCSATLSVSG